MIFCASKISNNGVKLDVPKDLKPQITDIAKKRLIFKDLKQKML